MLPVVLGICLCVGYVLKNWIKDIDNKCIPTVCAIIGIVLSAWLSNWTVTPQVVLNGMISGLASTGLHQAMK
ncbi:phage holin family protein [Lacrimispora sp.]|uniref:phage holin family protein n=1 Tax=Lacrimispora sp. TaxID=2719234 RepID=UPI0028A0FE07|nr:phage holin family protein [Lacrimispora sp.]